jgi:hypothetical protein
VSPGSAEQVAIDESEIRRRGDVRVTLGNTGAPSIRDFEPLSQVRVLLTKPVLLECQQVKSRCSVFFEGTVQ